MRTAQFSIVHDGWSRPNFNSADYHDAHTVDARWNISGVSGSHYHHRGTGFRSPGWGEAVFLILPDQHVVIL